MVKRYDILLLSMFVIQAFADSEPAVVATPANNPIVPVTTIPVTTETKAANIDNIDTNANDLLQLKRKIEVEKSEAELKKIRQGERTSTSNGISSINMDNVQTTVTGVAINAEGRKIAWLQFADGGSLMVNIGSRVGQYTVTEISMQGVQLSTSSRTKVKHVLLKRAYYTEEKASNLGTSNALFVPSPITTNANSNEMVPPIVPVR